MTTSTSPEPPWPTEGSTRPPPPRPSRRRPCSGFPRGTSGCTNDASCSGLSGLATCNTTTKNCELTSHAKQTDDAQCATCHGPTNGISPIAGRHAISPFNAPVSLEGYAFRNVSVTGGTGPGGSFQVGDTLTLKFQLFDNQATPASVADLKTNGAWAGTFLVAGPTSNPQRVYGAGSGGLNMKTSGTLTYDAASATYTYVPAATWPASSLAPINNPAAGTQSNPAGNYTVWFYWARTTGGVRDAVDAQVAVAFGVNQKASGRQVVTQAACGSCHGMTASGFPHLALHGGQRKNGETCSTCHTQNAFDRVVGSTWSRLRHQLRLPGLRRRLGGVHVGSVCTVTVDPTPGVVVDYQQLVHDIHFARLREGLRRTEQPRAASEHRPDDAELPGLQQQPARLPGDPRAAGRALVHQLPPEHQRLVLRHVALRLRPDLHVGASARTPPGKTRRRGPASPVTTPRTARPTRRRTPSSLPAALRWRAASCVTGPERCSRSPRFTTSPRRTFPLTHASPSSASSDSAAVSRPQEPHGS